MPGRKYSAGTGYRYGFNGKENDNDVKGEGNQQDYGERIYDPRVGKFLSIDPMTGEYPMLTPYQFGSNRPIDGIDQDGLEWKPVTGASGNVTDYTWSGFNADGSTASGTVSGASIVKDGATFSYGSISVGDFQAGTFSVDDGTNIRGNSFISGNSASFSFDEVNENGKNITTAVASGYLGSATGASGADIATALNSKYKDIEYANKPRPASGAIETDGLGLFDWIGPGEIKALTFGALGTVVRKEAARAIVNKVVKKVEISMARRTAVRQAWKEEKAMVKATGEGTRRWTKPEIKQLLKKGKVSGYQGHHINNVKHHPSIKKHVGNPDNIEFVTPAEHLDRHGGNYKNKSSGELLNRTIKN